MQERAVAVAVERALRDELALTDQPRAALRAIARELCAALDSAASVGGPQDSETLDAVRCEFSAVITKVWREYGEEETIPSIWMVAADDCPQDSAVRNA